MSTASDMPKLAAHNSDLCWKERWLQFRSLGLVFWKNIRINLCEEAECYSELVGACKIPESFKIDLNTALWINFQI